jgi:hypothetical protein
MKQFVTNGLFLFSLLLGVNGFGNLLVPTTEGDPAVVRKQKEVIVKPNNYNPIFIGSSRTYRHIDPNLFDSLMKQETGVTSYNLGLPATFAPEIFFCYEQMLEQLNPNRQRTIIMELQEVNLLAPKNLNSLKGTYWINNEYLIFSIKALWASPRRPLGHKVVGTGTFFIGWFLNHFGFNYVTEVKAEAMDRESLEENGFSCLDESMADKEYSASLWKRRNGFLADTTQVAKRASGQRKVQAIISDEKASEINNVLLNKLNQLISLSAEKNVNLIFILPPRLPSYKTVLPLGYALGNLRFFDLSSPDCYPELWMLETSFDVAHMNCDGASIYTQSLVQQLQDAKILTE